MNKNEFNDQILPVSDWAPFCFVIRDLFFSGSFEQMKKGMGCSGRISNLIDNCMEIEKAFGEKVHSDLFMPTSSEEINNFFNTFGIHVSKIKEYSTEGILDLASDNLAEEDYDETINLAGIILLIDPDNSEALELSGTAMIEQGKYNEGILQLQKATENDPTLIEAYSTLASTFFNLGEYELAIENWKSILRFNPDDFLAFFSLSEAYEKLNKIDEAKKMLYDYLKKYPNNFNGMLKLYNLHLKNNEIDSALHFRKKIMESNPKNPSEFETWAKFHFEAMNFQKVEDTVNEYIKKNPAYSFLNFLFVVPLVKKERFEEAYKIVAELKKSQIWTFYRLDDFYKAFLDKNEMERCGLLC